MSDERPKGPSPIEVRVSTSEVSYVVQQILKEQPLVAVMATLYPAQVLLGRGNQRWLLTIIEIPCEEQ